MAVGCRSLKTMTALRGSSVFTIYLHSDKVDSLQQRPRGHFRGGSSNVDDRRLKSSPRGFSHLKGR